MAIVTIPPAHARRTEYGLLLVVGVFLTIGCWLLIVNQPSLPAPQTFEQLAALLGLFAVASLFLSWRLPAADQIVLPVVALLSAIGMLSIRRLGTDAQYAGYSGRQVIWIAVGMVVLRRHHRARAATRRAAAV